jgi:hypothetical protein
MSDPTIGADKPLNLWDSRANAVKDAFVHAYEGYMRHAEGYDELLPVKGGRVNKFVQPQSGCFVNLTPEQFQWVGYHLIRRSRHYVDHGPR